MKKTLGERIQKLMSEQRPVMTQEMLEAKTGITQSFISQIINNKKKPGFDNTKKIAKALGVGVEYLFDDD